MAEKKQPDTLSTFNLSEVETESGLLKAILRLHDVGKMGCIPAIVVSYDYNTKIARVKPLLKFLKLTTEGAVGYERPMYDVPVYSISQGGFRIDLPLFPGNTGMLFAVDRDCETAKEKNSTHLAAEEDPENGDGNKNKGPQDPDSYALADFQFGFFLPMTFGGGSSDDAGKIIVSKIPTESDDDKPIRIEVSNKELSVELDSDKYKISESGLSYDGKKGENVVFLNDVRYDINSHQIQKKTITCKKLGTFIVNVGNVGDWEMITGGQAVPESEGE